MDGPVGPGDVVQIGSWSDMCEPWSDCFNEPCTYNVFNCLFNICSDPSNSRDWGSPPNSRDWGSPPNFNNVYDQYYWSYIEDMYVPLDWFSCSDKHEVHLYPLLFPDIYDMYPIHEDGLERSLDNVDAEVSCSPKFLGQDACTDNYVMKGDEAPMWEAVDNRACAGADLAQQFSKHWLPVSYPLPLGCPLKECTSIALRLSSDVCVDCSSASSIHIYIDGGYSPDDEDSPMCVSSSTWAFAVFAVDTEGCYKLQFSCGGHVTFCEDSELFLGEAKRGSFDPELYGQAMVRLFLLQCDIDKSIPIHIAYDNISAADCSFMNASPNVSTGLSNFASTVHFMASKLFDIKGFHVKSHNGDPWNELADSLCTFYKTRAPLVVRVPGAPFISTKVVCIANVCCSE